VLENERAGVGEYGRAARIAADVPARTRALTPGEAAWVVLVPCALVALAAILLLGPPLGHLLVRPSGDALWPTGWWEARGRPEPVKQGRFALAALAPLLPIAVVAANARRPLRMGPRAIRAVAWTSQLCLLAFVAVALLAQRNAIDGGRALEPVFERGMLALAAGLVVVAAGALRLDRVRGALAYLARERLGTRLACGAIAAAFASVWLLEALETDGLVEQRGLMTWTLNDVFAVLGGHDPLVDYHAIYAKLLPYPTALVLLAFGTTGFVYSLFMAVLSVLALLAVYAVLRRILHSSLYALALFAPFVALSDWRHTMIMAEMWPTRYGGAFLLAWLTARQLDGRRPRSAFWLFLVAGLVLINDLEFGIAALLASLVALVCARRPRSVRAAAPLLGALAGGLLAALAAASALTLARAGSLPHLGLLLEWPRVFTDLGWFSLPMPTLGLHLAIYATLAGALVVAAVRMARRDDDALLTSMLAWAGTFGLVAAGYYAGRSDEAKLASMFAAWAFALALLTIVSARALASRRWRAPAVPELMVLFGFGLAVAMLGQLVSPRLLIDRLTAPVPPLQYRPAAEQFIARHVARGQQAAILVPEGFRLAYELGIDNVAPYPNENAIVTRRQFRTLLDVLARRHVRELFVPAPGARLLEEIETAPQQLQRLLVAGYAIGDSSEGIVELRRTVR